VVKNLVITGVAGTEYGIRGWIAATDLTTQKEVWRTYTIPAKNGPGSETWKDSANAAATGGGSTRVTGTYDPGSNTLYWGVGNPGPHWDSQYPPGDNLYTDCTLALDLDTGKIKWHFQHTPNDPYDYDSVSENVLVDAPVNGRPMHLDLEADRNGFAYAVDRDNGSFVWGTPFVKKVTWTKGLDGETGKPVDYDPKAGVQKYNASVTPSRQNTDTIICPATWGARTGLPRPTTRC
jgi:alcohol dehydrogenase (cytochrome c)